jgi:TPR repeat protein
MIYYLGDGVPKNLAKAYHWIKLAAQQNDQRAVII